MKINQTKEGNDTDEEKRCEDEEALRDKIQEIGYFHGRPHSDHVRDRKPR